MSTWARQRQRVDSPLTVMARMSRPSLTRLRWITVAVPIAAVAALLHVTAFALPEVFLTTQGYVFAIALVVVASVAFSHVVFTTVERLGSRILKQNAQLAAAASVASALGGPGDEADVVRRALEGLCEPLGADLGIARLGDLSSGRATTLEYRRPADSSVRATATRLPEAEDLLPLMDRGTDAGVIDADADPDVQVALPEGLRTLIAVPIIAHGRSEGRLLLASAQPHAFDEEDRRLIAQSGQQIGMAVQRGRLVDEVMSTNAELRVVNGLAAELAEASSLPEVLDLVLRVILDVAHGRAAEFWLEDDDGLVLARELGTDGSIPPGPGDDIAGELRTRAMASGKAAFSMHQGVGHGWLPLRSHGRVFAMVHVVGREAGTLTPHRQRSLESIAEQCGPAVSNVRLRLRARELAVLEERGRIAREMHDGLAQVLAYVNTKAAAVRQSMAQGDASTAAELLTDLEEAARDVSADVREDLLALHHADPSTTNLCHAVRQHIEKFQRLSGIRVQCRVLGEPADVRLSEMTQLQVIRVVQEALSNVRKHAGVDAASVTLSVSAGRLKVRVDDEGRGFVISGTTRPDGTHFGLQTMRERTESVGGELDIYSVPGCGTHVGISVPLDPIATRPA